ncbi:MAG: DUF1376 domain-containing protein [Piscinibacter sp.]
MSSGAPDPLVPPEVDLRGLEYMPLFGNHLFGSGFNAAATDAEWRAAVTLWWAAWNQVPAGSLPSDDKALCRLADLGRDLKAWRKLKQLALHGFTLCSDGRLYHEFLCGQALVAWEKRVKGRERKARWRASRDGDKGPESQPSERGRNADVPAERKGRDGKGREGKGMKVEESAPSTRAAVQPADVDPQVWADWLQLRAKKRAPVTQTVIDGARAEAGKAGLSLEGFLRTWCTRGSQGLDASWLMSPAGRAKQSARADAEAWAPLLATNAIGPNGSG